MSNKETETVAEKVPVNLNPLKVPFPQDPQGSFKALREGGLKSVNRVIGNQGRVDAFLKTLELLGEFVQAKHAAELERRAAAAENAKNAALRVAQRDARVAAEKLEAAVAQAKQAKAFAAQADAQVKALSGEAAKEDK